MTSFDYHCVAHAGSRDDLWNPVEVRYLDGDDVVLNIRISPDDAIFNRDLASDLSLDTVSANFSSAQYYELNDWYHVQLVDPLENDVIVDSNLSLEATKQVIGSLTLVGNLNAINPWDSNCP